MEPIMNSSRDSSEKSRGTILLVEDNDIVRRVAIRALENGGFTVIGTRDGAEALAQAKAHTEGIDLVLTDMLLPQQNGPDIFRAISNTHPESRVLYMSGYPEESIQERGLLPPGSPFIEKTFTRESLLKKVKDVLNSASSSTSQ